MQNKTGRLVAVWVSGKRIDCVLENAFEVKTRQTTAFNPWGMAVRAASGTWDIPMVVREVPTPTSVKEAEERLPPSI